MQIQVNNGERIVIDEAFADNVRSTVGQALSRFEPWITRVEVHLADVNGEKAGANDKRCLLEARPAGHEPVAVTAQAPDVQQALHAATQKLERRLTSLRGRLDDRE